MLTARIPSGIFVVDLTWTETLALSGVRPPAAAAAALSVASPPPGAQDQATCSVSPWRSGTARLYHPFRLEIRYCAAWPLFNTLGVCVPGLLRVFPRASSAGDGCRGGPTYPSTLLRAFLWL